METKKGKTDIVKRKSKILGAAAVMAVTLVLGGFTVFAEESIFVNVTGKYGQTEAKTAKEPDSSDFEIDKNGVLVKYKGSGGDVIIPDGVKSIGDMAFYGCSNLRSIKIPKSVNSIGNIAFTDCPKLLSIEVASGNAKYYSVNGVLFDEEKDALLAYPAAKAKKTYQIPEGVKSIENSAFFGCSSLRSIELPESLSVIGDRAFVYCSSLTGIELPENVNSIGNIAFAACDKLLSIEVASGNAKYYSVNGVLFDKEKDSLFAYPAAKAEKTYQIPEGVESIENSAFAHCSALTGIQIPEGVVSIGNGAFAECNNLKSIHIPESVESIGYFAFDRCEALIISCSKDSAAESYAKENNIPYQYITGESQTIKAKDITKTYGAKAFSLGAKASGGGKLTYTVSDKKVAAVSKTGRVTIKGCGVTKIKIKAAASKNHAAAAKTITLTVKPKQQKISSLKSQKAKTLTVKWKKDAKATGYILQYSTDKKFKKAVKTVTIKKNGTTAKTVSKLKGGKKYYVRVCSYKTSGGKPVKGAYSPAKAVTVRR